MIRSVFFKKVLDGFSFKRRRRFISIVNYFRTIGRSNDLSLLARILKTDKWGYHYYTEFYQSHFEKQRNKPTKLLEIGVGGYDHPQKGAGSLRMWKRYFSKGQIFAIDIFDKSQLEESRIKIFKGSQSDLDFLQNVVSQTGKLDVIIDDGSHRNQDVLNSFNFLFSHLNEGGIYVVEDTQTSYWPEYGGDSEKLDEKSTTMGYFKSLVDGLNHEEFKIDSYRPTYWDRNIESIHFYHNLIFIYKVKS